MLTRRVVVTTRLSQRTLVARGVWLSHQLYILTVAVSISSGAAYITTALPSLAGHEVLIAVSLVIILSLLNLRGTKEAGVAFAIPTYIYMGAIALMVIVGFVQMATGHLGNAPTAQYELVASDQFSSGLASLAGAFLLMRAFSSGCAALTGVEAISNGVPMFKRPKSKNAASTLALLGSASSGGGSVVNSHQARSSDFQMSS